MVIIIINSDDRTFTVSNEGNKPDCQGKSCS